MVFEHQGDGAHPAEEQIPKVQIAMKTLFRPLEDSQKDA
jgi:hypothetical protein